MLGLTGLIGESVNFTDDEIHRSFFFVTQGVVRNEDKESMAPMILVPREIAQFSGVKRLVDEEPFQIQNETEIVLKYFHACTKFVLHCSMLDRHNKFLVFFLF